MKRFVIAICVCLLLFVVSNVTAQIVDNFYISVDASGSIVVGGGSGYKEGMWYEYIITGWLSEWFYDHPFDYSRGKIIHIEFDLVVLDPADLSNLVFALSWSTPEWSELGHDDCFPPIPGGPDFNEFNEEEHIERVHLLCTVPTPIVTHYIFDYVIYDFNPEWVSIDVRGENIEILNGIITHDCVVASREESWGAIKSMYR